MCRGRLVCSFFCSDTCDLRWRFTHCRSPPRKRSSATICSTCMPQQYNKSGHGEALLWGLRRESPPLFRQPHCLPLRRFRRRCIAASERQHAHWRKKPGWHAFVSFVPRWADWRGAVAMRHSVGSCANVQSDHLELAVEPATASNTLSSTCSTTMSSVVSGFGVWS